MSKVKVISIGNFKGGVAKTTSTVNIGAGLNKLGKKVLLIDLDPQFNLTQSLGIEEPKHTIYEALVKEDKLEPIEVKPGLDVIASSLNLIRADIELSGKFKREFILTKLLEPIKDNYDYIILDCPPALGLLTINSFVASDFIYVPIEAEFLALKGYSVLTEALKLIGLEIDKVFITKYDKRKVLNRNVLESLREALEDKVFKTVIRTNIALAEAPTKGLDIYSYQPNSSGAKDYLELTKEILKIK